MIQAMTTAEVMEALQVKDPDTVYALVKAKRLPCQRLGRRYRFHPAAVEAFMRGEKLTVIEKPREPVSQPSCLPPSERIVRRRGDATRTKRRFANAGH